MVKAVVHIGPANCDMKVKIVPGIIGTLSINNFPAGCGVQRMFSTPLFGPSAVSHLATKFLIGISIAFGILVATIVFAVLHI